MSGKRRPGRLWLLFFGKKRRGFPELLAITLVALAVLALAFAIPGFADLARYLPALTIAALVILIVGSLVLVGLALVRQRGRR